jgi:hypothetical protein
MKALSTIFMSLLITASYALASGGSDVEGMSLITVLFIAFGVSIVLSQLIPGLMLLGGMLKAIFSTSDKKALEVSK